MKTLIFAPKATADIDHIYDYTDETWGYNQAEEYTFGIRDFCRALSLGERSGRKIDQIKRGYRALAYGSHFIVYRETPTTISIIRVLHQRMNIGGHL
ncbi:Plasmid stabilization system protein [Neorhizobium galegae bv. officinalis bv. officinalis str. HAMBI 1141]|uniref:Toxin n=1 Tax=Neorhizobium galegae bv. officinalis bv. officinalis str. HAMBI 1141 TaxID=1028801 RepID=A0A068TC26_NEOGA|nr:type II toxin-antitoxin system RelE/ParE family toxin [Neorhizobium galegae]CDN55973.1 Plasmid stabilization system protein [Neorhizobium galegae bv. officinalis bv. officinalis str. HAMBI 1141]